MQITVYTKPACPQCDLTKKHMERRGLAYEAVDITAPEQADDLERFKRLGFLSAPIVEVETVADGVSSFRRWAGFQPALIDEVAR